jgi:hypothetical protein
MADKVFRNPKTFFMAKKIGSKKVSTWRIKKKLVP